MTLLHLSARVSDTPSPARSSAQAPCEDCGLPCWLELRHALDLDRTAPVLCTHCVTERCTQLLAAAGGIRPQPREVLSP